MKAISLESCSTKVLRQRDQFGDGGLSAMKAGIEARHLRHVGQPFEDSLDGGQIVRLMQRGQWNQFANSSSTFRSRLSAR